MNPKPNLPKIISHANMVSFIIRTIIISKHQNRSPEKNCVENCKLSSAFWGYNELFPLLLTFEKKGESDKPPICMHREMRIEKKRRVILPQDHDAKLQDTYISLQMK